MIVRCKACQSEMLVNNPTETIAVVCPHCRAEVRVSSAVLLDDDTPGEPAGAELDTIELLPPDHQPQTLDSLAALTGGPPPAPARSPARPPSSAPPRRAAPSRPLPTRPVAGSPAPRRPATAPPSGGRATASRPGSTPATPAKPQSGRPAPAGPAAAKRPRWLIPVLIGSGATLLLGTVLLVVFLVIGIHSPPRHNNSADQPAGNVPDAGELFTNVKGEKQ